MGWTVHRVSSLDETRDGFDSRQTQTGDTHLEPGGLDQSRGLTHASLSGCNFQPNRYEPGAHCDDSISAGGWFKTGLQGHYSQRVTTDDIGSYRQ